MKKFGMIAVAALLVVGLALPAAALENTFGGSWQTWAVSVRNLDGTDVEGVGLAANNGDEQDITSRLRLFYTAGINENLKIVTGFEIDYQWGDNSIGDIGSDGKAQIEVKHVYADFNMGPVNAKVGTQGLKLARGYIASTDASGITLTYKGEGFSVPFIYVKADEDLQALRTDDVDMFAVAPTFTLGEGISINPYIAYFVSSDLSLSAQYGAAATGAAPNLAMSNYAVNPLGGTSLDAWYYGFDADLKFGPLTLYGTLVLAGGELEDKLAGNPDRDLEGVTGTLGAGFDMGMFSVRGQYLYISGEDYTATGAPNYTDNEVDMFWVPGSSDLSYAELITGNKTHFNIGPVSNISASASGNETLGGASNGNLGRAGLQAYNLGTTIKPMDKVKVDLDIWYAYLDNDVLITNATTGVNSWEDDLGTEVDLEIAYELVEGMTATFTGAYMFAGDAVYTGNNDADPYLLGLRLNVAW